MKLLQELWTNIFGQQLIDSDDRQSSPTEPSSENTGLSVEKVYEAQNCNMSTNDKVMFEERLDLLLFDIATKQREVSSLKIKEANLLKHNSLLKEKVEQLEGHLQNSVAESHRTSMLLSKTNEKMNTRLTDLKLQNHALKTELEQLRQSCKLKLTESTATWHLVTQRGIEIQSMEMSNYRMLLLSQREQLEKEHEQTMSEQNQTWNKIVTDKDNVLKIQALKVTELEMAFKKCNDLRPHFANQQKELRELKSAYSAVVREEKEAWQLVNEKEIQISNYEKLLRDHTANSKRVNDLYGTLAAELQCVICTDVFVDPVVLNCSHSFCATCISQWRNEKPGCPVCRESITHQVKVLAIGQIKDKILSGIDIRI